jgi:ubiquinone/menaquinone biosynthesis C-methylase UbiE
MILNASQILRFFLKRWRRVESKEEYMKYQDFKSNIIIEYIKRKKILTNSKHSKLLEIGASYGGMTNSFREIAETAISIDIDKESLRYINFNDFSHCICCDALKLPIEDNAFDSIICISVIEHVNDRKKLLDEMNRTLKEHGIIIIGFPPWNSIYGGHMNMPFTSLLPSKIREHIKKYSFIKYYPTIPLSVKKIEEEINQYFKIIDKNSFFLPKFLLVNPIQEIEPFIMFVCQKKYEDIIYHPIFRI